MAESCRICGGGEELTFYEVREMMFGTREPFRYFQCGACGCLQIAEIPEDLSKYYPDGYYAHAASSVARSGVRAALRKTRNRYVFFREGLLGRVLSSLSPYPYPHVHRWLSRNGLTRDSRILDVGCGSGLFLYDLAVQGYRNLLGADPFIAEDIDHDGLVRVVKAPVHAIEGKFDLVMLHHALEHIPDQIGTLREVARLLAPAGECLIRIPVVSSFAWEHYREHWAQVDAPRHLFLHSIESIRLAGERAGLEVAEVQHDSGAFQFVVSELYRRGLPRSAEREVFSRRDVRRLQRRSEELNREGRGDSAVIYLRKAQERPDTPSPS